MAAFSLILEAGFCSLDRKAPFSDICCKIF